jgi:hypothetical protein
VGHAHGLSCRLQPVLPRPCPRSAALSEVLVRDHGSVRVNCGSGWSSYSHFARTGLRGAYYQRNRGEFLGSRFVRKCT